MKKLIALLLAIAMVFGLIACGNSSEPAAEVPESTNAAVESPAEETPTEAASGEKQNLKIAVLVGSSEDKAADSPYLAWVKNSYENWELKDQVNLEIEEVYGSSSDFITKMQLEMASENTCPDVVWADSFQLTADVAAGYIADISPYISDWESWNNGTLVEAMKTQVTIGDGVYGIPSTTDTRGLIYNKTVLIEAGVISSYEEDWQPANWQELMDALYAIKNNTDAIPFWACMSAGEGEGTSMHNFETWFYATGEQLMYNDDGNWNFDGKAWEDTATILSTIVNDGLTMPTAELLDAKPNAYAFDYMMNNKLGMFLHNTSNTSRFGPDGKNALVEGDYTEVIGVAAMPTQNGDGAGFSTMSGGLCWAVPALSKNQELGAEFLMHMMDVENYLPFIIDYGSLSVLDLSDYAEYNEKPFTKEASDLVAYTHFRPHHEDYSAVSTCIYQMVENLAMGMSVEEALDIFRSDAEFAINS